MVLASGGILVPMWILGHDFSGHYNRLALISVDIISGVYCTLNGHPFRSHISAVYPGKFDRNFRFGN